MWCYTREPTGNKSAQQNIKWTEKCIVNSFQNVPECIDIDEYIFKHKTSAKQGCVNGESCSDQSC